jgi:hypothetical protein
MARCDRMRGIGHRGSSAATPAEENQLEDRRNYFLYLTAARRVP